MSSKFSWKAYVPLSIITVLLAVLTFIGIIILDPVARSQILPMTPLFLFPIFALVWLIYGECRTKIIRVSLNFDTMVIRRYFGLAKPQTYYYADLSGYTITLLPAQDKPYEYLYIKQGEKTIGKLSQYYHKNYDELKSELEKQLKNLGYVEFSYMNEIREIFK